LPTRSKRSSSRRSHAKKRRGSKAGSKKVESKKIKAQEVPSPRPGSEPGGFDLMSHVLVPQHEIVSQEEREELIRKFGPLRLFPKILVTDPVVRQLGAKPGDVIRIIRPGEKVPAYRVVVRGG